MFSNHVSMRTQNSDYIHSLFVPQHFAFFNAAFLVIFFNTVNPCAFNSFFYEFFAAFLAVEFSGIH